MDLVHRPVPVRQLQATPPRFGEGIAEGPGPAQGLGHPVADLPAAQAGLLGLRIHRDDLPGPVADQVDDRIGHPEAAPETLDLAEDDHLGALGAAAWPARAG